MGKTSLSDAVYDTITILISIADVTTDIIVLISFYNQGRISYFVISLIILILAQLAYSILFIIRYDVFKSACQTLSTFFILLPFGSFVSFIIYFTNDPNSWLSTKMKKWRFDVNNSFLINHKRSNHSKMRQWMIKKLSKHIGFIIEAGVEGIIYYIVDDL